MNEVDNAHADALRAAHQLTQRGQLDAAERVVAQIRSSLVVPDHPSIAVHVMVIEGCIAAYRGDWSQSRDRLERAKVLATHIADADSELLASAWLSYIAFIESDFDSSLSHARSVIERHRAAGEFALFRACAIVVLLLYFSGRPSEAEQWFKFTKRIAESLHEPAATSVIIFDIAAMRASGHRFDNRSATVIDDSAIELDLVFARSARNFDDIGSISVMPALHPLLESQILNLLGRYVEAKVLLEVMLDSPDLLPGIAINQARLELLWARAKSEKTSEALSALEQWRSEISHLVDDDDVAVYCARASQVFIAAGAIAEGDVFALRGNEAAQRFLETRSRLWSGLEPIHGMLPELSRS